jgi:branched-chain amino acid transport system substrate-binding protein
MFGNWKRAIAIGFATLALAGCKVIPDGGTVQQPGPVATAPAAPSETVLPTDAARHRVALLVPLSGSNAAVGQAIANATTMALLDTSADNLRITTYDTAQGAGAAASRAVSDGNALILGPLVREDVGAVLAQARPANIPLITFSNDAGIARPDVFVMGLIPEQSVIRTVNFAIEQGARRFAVLAPEGEYGDRALAALRSATGNRASVVQAERFSRSNRSIVSAAQRLTTAGGFDTVLIADGARLVAMAAPELKDAGVALPSIIGTELWAGESSLADIRELNGAWFATVSDSRMDGFVRSYETRFGETPNRLAPLGYDAVLLTLRIARNWQPGQAFPVSRLIDSGGFLGVDGPFRFLSNGTSERALEVRQIGNGRVDIVNAAPTSFAAGN